jgi:hypothetical protein
MLAVSRFRYADDADDADAAAAADAADRVQGPLAELGLCLERLSQFGGFVSGTVGRALDDPTLWLLTTTWRDVGSYRRALSSYEVKAEVAPILSKAIDEPSAYEALAGEGAVVDGEANVAKPRETG